MRPFNTKFNILTFIKPSNSLKVYQQILNGRMAKLHLLFNRASHSFNIGLLHKLFKERH